MLKLYIILLGILLSALTPIHSVNADTEDMYVTTEDIVLDIIFPIVDNRVIKEYGGDSFFNWQWQRIVGINYNDSHSYDVAVKILILSKENIEDLIKIRVSPSCDSGKINNQKCKHDFKIEILEYKHLSK
ncbi:hypothetical protein ACFSO7_15920 [Bacillus sp. CGMCC 1.16607]|uniref:hypothetical protein n=1 Tax=Bacillus sp. CGMCC 1.16607 TaxID=3351842 RepID=UPI0036445E20